MFHIDPKSLGTYDVAVCGGGVAGVCTAVTAAREGASVILIEADGCLGGIMTESTMPLMLDCQNKGGLVREFFTFLDARGMTGPRRGPRRDENGQPITGPVFDIEGAKYFFDCLCKEAGVKVLLHSRVSAVDMAEGRIAALLLSTDCGLYSLSAQVYVDASGNGDLAAMAGCPWACGQPGTGQISPASIGMALTGFDPTYMGTESAEEKTEYGDRLKAHGIRTSTDQACVLKLPQPGLWDMSVNFQYDVSPEDIEALSTATIEGRRESFEVIEAHKKIPGYEQLCIAYTSSHLGQREGRRIYGVYRLTDDDILAGRRFDDAVCLVTAGVDVHKLNTDDTLDCKRGYRTKPYHIPYGCLVARDCEDLLLAGRCISGDFYPHASYRMMGNMSATGEAAGYAAAMCVKQGLHPAEVDGTKVSAFMRKRGYVME